jgi:2-iminobutanoate/2-iminopropanoate deaminase
MSRHRRSIEVPGLSHNAPIPPAARVGPVICSSGISGKDAATGKLPDDAATQARNAFSNMRTLLEAADASVDSVVKLTVYARDDSVRGAVNAEWLRCFPDPADRPARHILIHELQHGMWLQLEFIAVIQ